jgi:hypothetical protein
MTTLVLDRVERRPRDGTSASLAGGDGDDSTIAENFRREGFFPPGTPTDAFPRLRVVRRGSSEEEDDVREDVFVSFFLDPGPLESSDIFSMLTIPCFALLS